MDPDGTLVASMPNQMGNAACLITFTHNDSSQGPITFKNIQNVRPPKTVRVVGGQINHTL